MRFIEERNPAEPPVMSLSEAFATIKAVARGLAPLPDWAGKRVYIGQAAKDYWEGLNAPKDSDAKSNPNQCGEPVPGGK